MENNGILLEESRVAALEALDGLSDRVCPIVDIKKSTGPLIVYDQQTEGDEQELDGDAGLLTATFQVHVLHNTFRQMRLLSEKTKSTLKTLRGKIEGPLRIEAVTVELASPDILETKVQMFRRTYKATFYYQIKEE